MHYPFLYSFIHLAGAATAIHAAVFSREVGRIRNPRTITQSAILACLMLVNQSIFSTWSDYLYLFATMLMPMLTEYRILFQLSNVVGVHRAVYLDTICLWQKAIIVSIHMGLFSSNMDKYSYKALCDSYQRMLCIIHWRLIRLYEAKSFDTITLNCSLDSREFVYDTNEKLFFIESNNKTCSVPVTSAVCYPNSFWQS
ncbi:hypothetical protein BX667DRAFT_178153 [Coemansia mojavensis]|nr:hypothetical protein BX667DRAFT_311931 [Coemansia mojavensis]KAI9468317.1 hypothetical protein BX667DRAFT_178153 [Coemansia mojavensis]